MKPSISQENKKIIKFLTTIILIIIIIIIIYISCVYVNEEINNEIQNDFLINNEYITIDYKTMIITMVDTSIALLTLYMGNRIYKKYIKKKASLANLDESMCSITDRRVPYKRPTIVTNTSTEVTAAGEVKGGMALVKNKDLINRLILAIRDKKEEDVNNIFQNELEWVRCGSQQDTNDFLQRIIGEDKNGNKENYIISNNINHNYYIEIGAIGSENIGTKDDISEYFKNEINKKQDEDKLSK
jgi:hypothetical protein